MLPAELKIRSPLCKEHRKTRKINSKLNNLKICGKPHHKAMLKKTKKKNQRKTLLRSYEGQTAH